MEQSEHDKRIDYIEIASADIPSAKKFYSAVFGWNFVDYGPGYASFNDGRLSGGFGNEAHEEGRSVLIVLYATDLDLVKKQVVEEGGTITRETFSFPGGRRFHFTDPGGLELAVWSE
ncbi:MAG: VOC family protein [Actinomycetota bacterium]|nr:VOC family protein [Actinomycetota bacterium]